MASLLGRAIRLTAIVLVVALVASEAAAQTATATANQSATAWVLTATALVLFMTMPGLALFYGGLVHSRNVLSVLMNWATGLIATLVWSVVITFIILKIVQAITGLRVREDEENEGLDVSTHGERGYTF